MIVFEGPDGAGKTTLINRVLLEYPDLEVSPRVVSKDTQAMTDLQAWVTANLADGAQYKIFDRHRLISEFIYGPTLRPKPEPGFTSRHWVEASLRKFYALKPILIYCLPPLETIRENIRYDPTNLRVWDHIDQIYTAYLERATLDVMYNGAYIYDYTTENNDLNFLHLRLNELHERIF